MTKTSKTRRAGNFPEEQHDGHTNESAANCVHSHDEYTAEQLASARRTYHRALAWIENNPDAWAYADRQFRLLGSRRRKFAMQAIIEAMRDRRDSFTPKDGKRFAISHNYRSVFTRILLGKYPSFAAFVKYKPGPLDVVMGEGRDDG